MRERPVEQSERSLDVDEVVEKLSELLSKATKRFGYDHKGVKTLRDARNAIAQLRRERDRAFDRLADACDLFEEMRKALRERGLETEADMSKAAPAAPGERSKSS